MFNGKRICIVQNRDKHLLNAFLYRYSILFIRDNCRKEPHKRVSLYFIVQYTPRLSIYILDLCFIYNKPILCVVSPNQTCIIACLTVAKIPMSSDVDFEMTRNITSVQWSNKDLAILDKTNPLRNMLPCTQVFRNINYKIRFRIT